jgi:hypothetical protein
MISLKGGLFEPLTGTQNRDTAFMAYRMDLSRLDAKAAYDRVRSRGKSGR